MFLKNFKIREIKNSRGEKTIELEIETKKGKFVASAPSGKSRGKNEAEPFSRKGFNYSFKFLNAFCKKLKEEKFFIEKFSDLQFLEEKLKKYDNTKNWRIIGGNVVYVLEAVLLKAMSADKNLPLWKFLLGNKKPKIPKPLGNCIGGGKHFMKKELGKRPDFQEFLLLPETSHFFDAQFINQQAYNEARNELKEKKDYNNEITDENALAPELNNESVLDVLSSVKSKIKEKFGINLGIGIDCAASTLLSGTYYVYYENKKIKRLTQKEQFDYILDLILRYKLSYIEDPFEEEDFKSFSKLLKEIHKKRLKTLICGDDLICTQIERLKKAVKEKAVNSIIIKPNQNGSILKTKEVVDFALKNRIVPVISHRSGETLDNTISHLAIGWQIPIIKAGIVGKERLAKLNEIKRIEREIS